MRGYDGYGCYCSVIERKLNLNRTVQNFPEFHAKRSINNRMDTELPAHIDCRYDAGEIRYSALQTVYERMSGAGSLEVFDRANGEKEGRAVQENGPCSY